MADNNQTLLTVVIIVIAALIVLWLLWSLDQKSDSSNCYGPSPDPVGGIKSESLGPGQVKISWDHTPNADHYRVFLNDLCDSPVMGSRKTRSGFNLKGRRRHPRRGCSDPECCPSSCNECVSQSNYKSVIETCDNHIVIETCESVLCFIVVPYNKCGQAGKCKEVQYVEVECIVDEIDAWIVSNDCRGLEVRWMPPKCCDTVNVYVDGQLVDSVDAAAGVYTSEGIDCCAELALQCETSCGLGALNVLLAACPAGVKERPPSQLTTSRRGVRQVRQARGEVHKLSFSNKKRKPRTRRVNRK